MPQSADSDAPLQTAQGALESCGRTLGIARSLIEAETQVDLGGLDADCGLLCARVLDLPIQQGRSLRPALLLLRQEIDVLLAALTARAPPGD